MARQQGERLLYLSSAPMRAALAAYLAQTGTQRSQFVALYASRFGLANRTAWRDVRWLLQRERIPFNVADQLALAAGTHPILIWGGEYENA